MSQEQLDKIETITLSKECQIHEIRVRVGAEIWDDQPLFDFSEPDKSGKQIPMPMLSHVYGRVLEILVNEGDIVESNSPIMRIQEI